MEICKKIVLFPILVFFSSIQYTQANNLKDIKPTRSFKEDDKDDGKDASALGSLGLKPKPAI